MMKRWHMDIEGMPEFDKSMERIAAWFEHEIIDRAPVRFNILNPDKRIQTENPPPKRYGSYQEQWYDFEYTIESIANWYAGQKVLAESFPFYYPNLGPSFYAALYGAELKFAEGTSWSAPLIKEARQARDLKLDWKNKYLQRIDVMTDYALDRLKNIALVGYTDLHPGADCVADWVDPQTLCYQLTDDPEGVKIAVDQAERDFEAVYDHFDAKLKAHDQLSISWLGMPSFGRMHIPSCDFSSMISTEAFREFCLPAAQREMRTMTHNVWHLDGPGCTRHLDDLLAVKEIHAIQWVQGAGDSAPVLQWISLIKKIQSAGKSVMVGLTQQEFEPFLASVSPEGIFLTIETLAPEDAVSMLKRVEKWK